MSSEAVSVAISVIGLHQRERFQHQVSGSADGFDVGFLFQPDAVFALIQFLEPALRRRAFAEAAFFVFQAAAAGTGIVASWLGQVGLKLHCLSYLTELGGASAPDETQKGILSLPHRDKNAFSYPVAGIRNEHKIYLGSPRSVKFVSKEYGSDTKV